MVNDPKASNAKELDDLENIFTYHKPFGNQPERYEALRRMAKDFARAIILNCPKSRERSLAITNIQTTIMYANAAIAINEKEIDKGTSST